MHNHLTVWKQMNEITAQMKKTFFYDYVFTNHMYKKDLALNNRK